MEWPRVEMIKRLDIRNFGSFSGFDWNSSVRQEQEATEFKCLNILFGRNYSGKTTLSRIFQSLELERLPDNYQALDFEVITDSETLTHQNISSHSLDVRVYNVNFIKENLSFLTNEKEGEIRTFAIIGSENKEIEKRIQEIEKELGDEEEKNGKRYELTLMREDHSEKKQKVEEAKNNLEGELRQHANNVIKPNRKYGNTNYNIRSIRKDIKTIRNEAITVLEASEADEKEKLLGETPLPSIDEVSFTPNLKALYEHSVEILAAEITPTKPIEYLINDPSFQAWVKAGMDHHRNRRRSSCGFCGQDLPIDIWEKLDAHFSEASTDLEGEIKKQIELLEQKIESSRIERIELPGKDSFYKTVYSEFSNIADEFNEVLLSYRSENQKLLEELKDRQKDIFTSRPQSDFKDLSEEVSDYICKLNKIIKVNNQKNETLSEDQQEAREELRLNDVLNFINRIGLSNIEQRISDLEKQEGKSKDNLNNLESHVKKLEKERDDLQSKLQDEQEGAKKVNEYLNHFFGFDRLKLVAEEDEAESNYKFQIMRGDQPAYNMSEGECSLLSFCYFMAKLEEAKTKGKDLIIYIDDPVSSLDNNHIFFVFSLIESVLAKPKKNPDGSNRYRYKQLFISTHNLDFLKYLKTLSTPKKNNGGAEFFLVEKEETSSNLRLMPKYLKDYQTEFIYLFHQIYKCREARASEKNHQLFYSLGNNLRKFLEAYLFYKYPCIGENDDRLERLRKFFGDDETAIALTNRINNELSHLEAIFDRSMRPVDIPELPKVVNFVLDTIKEKDKEQYNSLLESIGESPENERCLGG